MTLILFLASLVPRAWHVDRLTPSRAQHAAKQVLSIEEFFMNSARYKRRLFIAAALFSFAGIALVTWSVF